MIKNITVDFVGDFPYKLNQRRILVKVKAFPDINPMTVKAILTNPKGDVIYREATWPSWRGGYLAKKNGKWPNIGWFTVGFKNNPLRGWWKVHITVIDEIQGITVYEYDFDVLGEGIPGGG